MSLDEKVCVGCGVKIQTEDPSEIGYAPKAALEKEQPICQRCFRLKHYNEIQDVSLTNEDFLKILHGIGNTKALVVKVVDIFDFNGSWINGIQRFIGYNPVILIGNKADLLPKSVKKEKVIRWMKREAKEYGLTPLDVLLISSEKGHGIKEAAEQIDHYRNGENVYVVGCTNVGKSTFINRILKEVTGEGDIITTSHYPGTTLNLIEIPLDDGAVLYDTPGIINDHQMAHFIDKRDLKLLSPKKEIKPRVFQLNERQTLYFGGLARLDYIKGGRSSIVCYIPNSIDIHRTKLEKADHLYATHLGELLTPPRKEAVESFPELVPHEFTINGNKKDIVFSGLGWVTIHDGPKRVVAYAPKDVHVGVRHSLI